MPTRRRDDDDEPIRAEITHRQVGTFGTGFGLSVGCIMGVLFVFVGIPLLVCAGIVGVTMIGANANHTFEAKARPVVQPPAPVVADIDPPNNPPDAPRKPDLPKGGPPFKAPAAAAPARGPKEAVLEYLKSTSDNRHLYVIDGDWLKLKMQAHYSDRPPYPPDLDFLVGDPIVSYPTMKGIPVAVEVDGRATAFMVYCRNVKGRWLVDWESSVGFNDPSLKVLKARPPGRDDPVLRLTAEIDDYYNYRFTDGKRAFLSVRLRDTRGESIHGYALRDSRAGRRLDAMLADGKAHKVVVALRWSGDESSVAEIINVIDEGWYIAPPEEDAPPPVQPKPDPAPIAALPKPEPPKPPKPVGPPPDAILTPPKGGQIVLTTTSGNLDLYLAAEKAGKKPVMQAFVEQGAAVLVGEPTPVLIDSRGPRVSYVKPLAGPGEGKVWAVLTAALPK